MRSVDAANIVWALYHHEEQYYIRTTDKKGQLLTFNVQGVTLTTLIHYIFHYLEYPAMFLFRYTAEPHKCLGSDRLAKRAMNIMTSLGIDTTVYKSHSLRGATATHLLSTGTPHGMVQARGSWASSQTLDMYYNRLHQKQNWEELLGGHAAAGIASASAVPPLPVSQPKPTEEGERRETQGGGGTAQADALIAHGVLRPLHCQLVPHLQPLLAK